MYTGSFLTVLVTSYLFILSGAQKISTCPDDHVHVQENKYNTMRCENFDDTDTVIWRIGQSLSVLISVATCKPIPSCSLVLADGVVGADRITGNGPEYSELYLNVTRSQHNYVVVCGKEWSAGTSFSLPCRLHVTGTSRQTPEDSDVPVAAIVGGIVAAVAVIIVIVVVLLVVFRKHRRQKPTRSGHGSDASKENDEFEEHANPINVTSEDPDDTHNTDHKPSAIAPRISSSTKNGKPDPPNSLEADHYTTVDGEVDNSVDSATNGIGDGFGGYEDIMFGSNENAQGRRADEYAVVDKSRANKGPVSAAIVIASPAHTTEGSDAYAVVDKSPSRNKGNKDAQNVSPGLSTSDTNNAGADVYAQVNKPSKTDTAFAPETKGEAYAQVQKPKPAAKPAKLSSKTDVTQRGATDDDEYNTLSHTRGSPLTQGQVELESQYSHVGSV